MLVVVNIELQTGFSRDNLSPQRRWSLPAPGIWEDITMPDLPLTAIERPQCLHCQTRMMLVQISDGPADYDLRTFECPKCDQVLRTLIASDPMRGGEAKGWLCGELNRPPS
jgi:hypothetical protein